MTTDLRLSQGYTTQDDLKESRGRTIPGWLALPFLIAATSSAYFAGAGRIYLSEVVAIFCIAWFASHGCVPGPFDRQRMVFLLGTAWLAVTVVTGVVHDTSVTITMKTVANVLVLLLDILAVWLLLSNGRERAARTLSWGLVFAGVAGIFYKPDLDTQIDPWKFGLAFPITVVSAVYLSRCAKRRYPVAFFALLGLLHIYLNYRSLGAICLVVAAVVSLWGSGKGGEVPEGDPRNPTWRPRSVVVVLCLLVVTAWGASSLYAGLAGGGHLGAEAEAKFASQSEGKLGVLGGGRNEIYFNVPAIIASPLIGLGGEPRLTDAMASNGQDLVEALGYRLSERELEHLIGDGLVPTHSYMMQAWVQAGLAGGLFWLVVLWLVLRTLIQRIRVGEITPLDALLGLSLSWNILFSPLGAQARLIFAAQFALFMISPRLRKTSGA
jgi:hypothetical protein